VPEAGFGGDIPVGSRFLFEVDGVEIGVFGEVSGLELTVSVEQFEEGGQNGFVHKLPGRMSWPNLVFRRGITDSDALFSWVQKSSGEGFAANNNKLQRCTGAITVVASDTTRLRSWEIDAAFPIRWTGPRLDVSDASPLNEELEVAHHGFRPKTLSS
jgi:phage tail-like protein